MVEWQGSIFSGSRGNDCGEVRLKLCFNFYAQLNFHLKCPCVITGWAGGVTGVHVGFLNLCCLINLVRLYQVTFSRQYKKEMSVTKSKQIKPNVVLNVEWLHLNG